jgi:hypothetical protein
MYIPIYIFFALGWAPLLAFLSFSIIFYYSLHLFTLTHTHTHTHTCIHKFSTALFFYVWAIFSLTPYNLELGKVGGWVCVYVCSVYMLCRASSCT